MHKKLISFILIFTFLLSSTLELWTVPRVFAYPKTLHVPTQYPTIQAAINAANSGDIIQVASGTYNESILVNKSVWLIAENPSNTIIDGNRTERNTVHVVANNVRIEGFTIQNGENPFEPSSLSVGHSRGLTISNNIIRQSDYGLLMRESNDSYILSNVIANSTVAGIRLSSSNRNNVVGNLVEKNSISVWIADISSKNNTFYHNNFINNTNKPSVFTPAKWDNGTEVAHTHTEGNYWSDYGGVDDGSGEGRWHEPRVVGDGIGDGVTPLIPHLGVDWYPLMTKWQNTVPTANFTYSPTEPKEIQEIHFTDTSTDPDGTVKYWLWNFGDGNSSAERNPIHTYLKKGTYTVALIVKDNKEATDTKVRIVTVVELPVTDNTFYYYIFIGIAAGAVILGTALFLWKKKKRTLSPKIQKQSPKTKRYFSCLLFHISVI